LIAPLPWVPFTLPFPNASDLSRCGYLFLRTMSTPYGPPAPRLCPVFLCLPLSFTFFFPGPAATPPPLRHFAPFSVRGHPSDLFYILFFCGSSKTNALPAGTLPPSAFNRRFSSSSQNFFSPSRIRFLGLFFPPTMGTLCARWQPAMQSFCSATRSLRAHRGYPPLLA